MSNYISLSQAFTQWQELAADIPTNDGPMLAESWNNYVDSLEKGGQLCALQAHYAPAYDGAMPGTGSRWDALSDDRAHILESMGVSLESVFVPFSQSRNKGEKGPSLNWRVTLKKDGREIIAMDYMQGSAHAPAYSNPTIFTGSRKRDEYTTNQRIREECETGRQSPRRSVAIDPPDVCDVFHSLLTDGGAIDHACFSDWADEYGYDSDSISARDTYDACLKIGLALRAAFGDARLRDLRDLFADM